MKQRANKIISIFIIVVAVLSVFATGLISCGGENGTLTKIEIFPANPSIAKGYSRQLYGAGTLSNGVIYAMTVLSWNSSNPEVATVSAYGLVTAGTKTGTTTISAVETDSNIHFTDTTTVTVADIESLSVTPVEPGMAISTAYQFVSTATFSGGATQNLTSSLTWTTSDAGLAWVVNTPGTIGNGLVSSGTATGTVVITATDLISTLSGTTLLTITSAPLASLAITPAVASIESGLTSTLQFTVMGTYADGTSKDLTSSMTWTTSDAGIATITNNPGTSENGLVTAGTATGTVIISATDPITTIFGSASLTVN